MKSVTANEDNFSIKLLLKVVVAGLATGCAAVFFHQATLVAISGGIWNSTTFIALEAAPVFFLACLAGFLACATWPWWAACAMYFFAISVVLINKLSWRVNFLSSEAYSWLQIYVDVVALILGFLCAALVCHVRKKIRK